MKLGALFVVFALVPALLIGMAHGASSSLEQLCKCGNGQHCVGGRCQVVDCTDFKLLNVTVEKPALVHAAFRLTTCQGVGITHLDSSRIIAFEDGMKLAESTLQLTSAGVSTELHIVILLDLSYSIQDLGHVKQMQGLVKSILETIPFDRQEVKHKVAIFGFAGSEFLTPLSDFESDRDVLVKTLNDKLSKIQNIDDKDSTSLFTAIQAVDSFLTTSRLLTPNTHSLGVVIVISDGIDTARRATFQEAESVIKASSHSYMSVPIGKDLDTSCLRALAPQGIFLPQSNITLLSSALREHTQKLILQVGSDYDLLLCSARRSGVSTLTVNIANLRGGEGKNSTSLNVKFDATGFESGCLNRKIVGTCVGKCGFVNGRFCGHCALEVGNHTVEVGAGKEGLVKSPAGRVFGLFIHSAPNGTLISWRGGNRIPNDYFYDGSTNETKFRTFALSTPQGSSHFLRFNCPTCENTTQVHFEIITDQTRIKYILDPPKPKPVVVAKISNQNVTTNSTTNNNSTKTATVKKEGSGSWFWNIVLITPVIYMLVKCWLSGKTEQKQPEQQQPKVDPTIVPAKPEAVVPPPASIDDFFSSEPKDPNLVPSYSAPSLLGKKEEKGDEKKLPSYGSPAPKPPSVPKWGPEPPVLPKVPLSTPQGRPKYSLPPALAPEEPKKEDDGLPDYGAPKPKPKPVKKEKVEDDIPSYGAPAPKPPGVPNYGPAPPSLPRVPLSQPKGRPTYSLPPALAPPQPEDPKKKGKKGPVVPFENSSPEVESSGSEDPFDFDEIPLVTDRKKKPAAAQKPSSQDPSTKPTRPHASDNPFEFPSDPFSPPPSLMAKKLSKASVNSDLNPFDLPVVKSKDNKKFPPLPPIPAYGAPSTKQPSPPASDSEEEFPSYGDVRPPSVPNFGPPPPKLPVKPVSQPKGLPTFAPPPQLAPPSPKPEKKKKKKKETTDEEPEQEDFRHEDDPIF